MEVLYGSYDLLDKLTAYKVCPAPTDPLGKPYQLMPGGRVQVQDPDDLPFITHGLPPGREPSNLVPEESK